MDSQDIQNQNKLDYQRKQQNKVKPSPLLKIGEYHSQTGRYKVIFPNGGEAIAGNKLFNSSVPTGTPVRTTQSFGSQAIALDYRNHQLIPLPQEEEKSALVDTYICCFLDTSGSMGDELPAIREALTQLKQQLQEQIYGTTERADKYFKVIDNGSEQWVNWLASDYRQDPGTEPDKILVLAFINESDSVYHRIPRIVSLEPTDDFLNDRTIFLESYQNRQFFQGRIFSVQYPPDPGLEEAFSAHVRDAVDGLAPYPAPGLKDFGCSYTLGIPASTSAEFYLQNIKELLGL
jgi:hypothetical protein